MPGDKRTHHHDVFISSTSKDLPDHRKAAIDAVWRHSMYPLAMERDTAWDGNAVEYSLGLVDEAEVYVGIFAYRYGYSPPGSDISITEMEYRRAVERDIPTLIFIMHEDHPIRAADQETGRGAKKLEKLKKELMKKHVVGFFNSPLDLGMQIFQALSDPDLQARLAPAEPPEKEPSEDEREPEKAPRLYVAHPYILTKTFFGRRSELAALDEWAASGDATLVIEAIGGIGKSALTWEWLKQEHPWRLIPDLAGAVWWSFYESDAAMTNFVRHTLAYVTRQPLKEIDRIPRDERERRRLAELCARPYLLALDGLERILVAYHRLDAPQLRDDQIEGVEIPAGATWRSPSPTWGRTRRPSRWRG